MGFSRLRISDVRSESRLRLMLFKCVMVAIDKGDNENGYQYENIALVTPLL
jgi:hypothetical protein